MLIIITRFKFLDVTPDGFAVTVGFVLSMSISRQGGRWVVKLKVVRPGKHKHKHKRWTVDLGTENLGTRYELCIFVLQKLNDRIDLLHGTEVLQPSASSWKLSLS